MVNTRGLSVAVAFTVLCACGGGGNSSGGGTSSGNNSAAAAPSNSSPDVRRSNPNGDGTSSGNNPATTAPSITSPDASGSNNSPNSPDAVGAFAYVANELSHNISAYSIDETTGALSPIPGSPFAADSQPRDIVVTPSGKFAYVANNSASNLALPLSRNIFIYTIDATTGALTRVGAPVEPGGFPSSLAMHPSGRAILVAVRGDPRGGSAAEGHHISGFAIDGATGLLTSLGSTPLNGWPSRITIDPAGRFAYVATEDSARPGSGFISVFAIDSTNGSLSEIAGSPLATTGWVQKFGITPNGRFAYAAGRALVGYAIDAATGALSELPGSPFSPSQIVTVHPSGKFVYGAEPGSDPMVPDSVTYAVNDSTGALSKVGSNGTKVSGLLGYGPSGNFVYGTNLGGGVSVNTWDQNTGMLTNTGLVGSGISPRAIATTNTYR